MKNLSTSIRALFVAIAITAGFAAAAQGQGQTQDQQARPDRGGRQQQVGTPAERADARLGELTAALSLSSAQATQIRTILVKRYTDSEALRTGVRGDSTVNLQAQREVLIQNANTAILAVLNPQQKAAYQALLAQEETAPAGRGPGGGGPGGGRGGPGARGTVQSGAV